MNKTRTSAVLSKETTGTPHIINITKNEKPENLADTKWKIKVPAVYTKA
jgi:hypothetical protein